MRDLDTLKRDDEKETLRLQELRLQPVTHTPDWDAERRYRTAFLAGQVSRENFGRIEPFKRPTVH